MMYRGCIIKIEKEHAIILTDTMQYLKVIKKGHMEIGKKIMFVKEDIYKEKQMNFKNVALAAAMIVLMIMSVTVLGQLNIYDFVSKAAAVVSIDINPSLEFEIDKENKIINANALNEDGARLLDRNFTDIPIDKAVAVVIKNAKDKNYISKEENSILITTAVLKDDFTVNREMFEKVVENAFEKEEGFKDINLIYIEANKKDLKEAQKNKISIGKYEIYKQVKGKSGAITIDRIKEMKVQEIVDKGIGKLKVKKISVRKGYENHMKVDEKTKNNENVQERNGKNDTKDNEIKKQSNTTKYHEGYQENKPVKNTEKEEKITNIEKLNDNNSVKNKLEKNISTNGQQEEQNSNERIDIEKMNQEIDIEKQKGKGNNREQSGKGGRSHN